MSEKPNCYKCVNVRPCISSACSNCASAREVIGIKIKLKKDDGSPHRNDPRKGKLDPGYIIKCSEFKEVK
mgnify:CR=1 FL=1